MNTGVSTVACGSTISAALALVVEHSATTRNARAVLAEAAVEVDMLK